MKKITSNLNLQFPRIFRIIPEDKIFKKTPTSKPLFYIISGFVLTVSIMLILGILIILVSFHNNLRFAANLIFQRQELQNKIYFWQSIANEYDGYKDAYFQIAVLEYRLGNLQEAKQANNKALLLDPNFEEAKKLDRLLK